jgi:hypothetical protein
MVNNATFEYAKMALPKTKAFSSLNTNQYGIELLQKHFPTAFGRERIDSAADQSID